MQKPTEDENLEFKQAKNQYDERELWEYCVALANEGGGHLLLGVTDDPPRSVVASNAFRNIVRTTERLYNKLKFRVNVEEVYHPHGRVVVFHIPSRPSGTAYHLDGRYLMRSGSQLVSMTEDRLRAIFAEAGPAPTKLHQVENRATDLLNLFGNARDEWLKSFDVDYLARKAPTQIFSLFTIAVPLTLIDFTVLNNPRLAPITPSITFEARGTQTIGWPWDREIPARTPIVRGERRDRVFHTNALFERVYNDGTIGLASVHTNAQRGMILESRKIVFNLAYFMLHIAAVFDSMRRFKAAADEPKLKYGLFVDLQIVGNGDLTLFRDRKRDYEFFAEDLQLPADLQLPGGHIKLPRHVIEDGREFQRVISELVRDLLHAAGADVEHDWKIELVDGQRPAAT
jgi:hypothetical protein